MGTLTFQLPTVLAADVAAELKRACMAGGPDSVPWPTELHVSDNQLQLRRTVDESGYLLVPWTIDGRGQLMGSSATLIERSEPYRLLVELARGKVNQVRCQAFDWRAGGLTWTPALEELLGNSVRTFGRALSAASADESDAQANVALNLAYRSAEQIVRAYAQQVFYVRHQRQAKLDTTLSCGLGMTAPSAKAAEKLTEVCNGVYLPFSWSAVENEESSYHWQQCDALLDWALKQQLEVTAGPLLDFSSGQLPAWLWLWERDLPSLSAFACKFVEATVRRYRSRIRRWQLTAASNCANVLALSEDDLLGLTYRLVEAARSVDPSLELIAGIARPWGEYMALDDRTQSPFIFADTLVRSGLNLAALDIELVMGVAPRGSYCRDLLDVSRLLDLYALLGVPLRVTLGYPSSPRSDIDADAEWRVEGGHWGDGFTPEVQAAWSADVTALALCKPYVHGVRWCHFRDSQPHQFPHCGLLDSQDRAKPAYRQLRELREKHLK